MACLVAFSPLSANAAKKQKKAKKAQTELWPDGTKMDAWFSNAQKVNVEESVTAWGDTAQMMAE